MIINKYIDNTAGILKKLNNEFYEQGFKIPIMVNRTLFEHGTNMRNAILLAMQNTKKASWFYKVTKSGEIHHPSEPGYPPAKETGQLSRSYNFDVRNMTLEIGSTAKYSEYLEDETKLNRPVLDPTVDAYENGIRESLRKIAPDITINIYNNAGVSNT